MPRSIEEVHAGLLQASEMLSQNLSTVLERYESNEYMAAQLAEFLSEWGNRPFHEFLLHIQQLDLEDAPDVLNGEMIPVNIFWIMEAFYCD